MGDPWRVLPWTLGAWRNPTNHLSMEPDIMAIEFWRGRGGVSFTRDETICVKNGSGKTVERITCLKVLEKKKDERGEYTPYKMDVQHVR